MFYSNDFITKNIKEQQIQEYVEQAKKDRLMLTFGTQRQNRFEQLARHALHLLGHGLSAVGHRLDQYDVSPHQDAKVESLS